jgi:hypothetical protein
MPISSAALLKTRAPRGPNVDPLASQYRQVRQRSLELAAPLSAEDAMVQSMDDASPAKWHLAHTTWFFEQFVLSAQPGHAPLQPQWNLLFNSYYQSVGPAHARPQRGLLSRPSLVQVLDYRRRWTSASASCCSPAASMNRRDSGCCWACSTSSSTRSCC